MNAKGIGSLLASVYFNLPQNTSVSAAKVSSTIMWTLDLGSHEDWKSLWNLPLAKFGEDF
jgi:hypothetical protein